jgi:hypothetical protein
MGITTATRHGGRVVEAPCFFLPSERPRAFPFGFVLTGFFAGLEETMAMPFDDSLTGLEESIGPVLAECLSVFGATGALLGPAIGWISAARCPGFVGLMPSGGKSPWRLNAKVWTGLSSSRSARSEEMEVVSIDASLSELQ